VLVRRAAQYVMPSVTTTNTKNIAIAVAFNDELELLANASDGITPINPANNTFIGKLRF
jgi:hypothetical protein